MNKSARTKHKKNVRGFSRTKREDWVETALDTLISEGVDSVKILIIAEKLNCARSSFYWYFKDRSDLLDSLLDHWQATNTKALVSGANQTAKTINFAIAQVYSKWVTKNTFDTRLDFAVRDWARRSGSVRRAVDISDAARLAAFCSMFQRYGYSPSEADVRARILYFTQIGYDALDQRESSIERSARGREYLYCLTGKHPTDAEVKAVETTVD